MITGLNTGLFQILAHPDVVMVNFEKTTEYLLECMDQIFQVCQNKNIVVEINANGFRNRAGYPNAEVWQRSKKYNLTTIISSDAHNPTALVDQAVKQAEQLVKQWGIEITEKLNLFDKPIKTV